MADIALRAVLFYAGLRRSEAAALARGDVEEAEDRSGLLWVRRSKAESGAERDARWLPRGRAGGFRGDPSGGWSSAGTVIRYTRREPAKRGAVAKYLENRKERPS